MTRSIYVIQSDYGPVKIGLATKVSRRLSQIRTGSPAEIKLKYLAACDGNLLAIERRSHKILGAMHLRGEWFKVDIEQAIAAVLQAAFDLGFVLTPINTTSLPRRGGPPKVYTERVLITLRPGTCGRIGAVLGEAEERTEFLREAIEREIVRRSNECAPC